MKIGPNRKAEGFFEETGIYVRAINEKGRWESTDIAYLDKESLLEFLRRGGEENTWMEGVVLHLLGHE